MKTLYMQAEGAVLPWRGVGAVSYCYSDKKRVGRKAGYTTTQTEIDACLNCPLAECDEGRGACVSYRARYMVKHGNSL